MYYIEVVAPSGLGITSIDAGIDDNLDSDFDGESASTALFTYTGVRDDRWDCGFASTGGS